MLLHVDDADDDGDDDVDDDGADVAAADAADDNHCTIQNVIINISNKFSLVTYVCIHHISFIFFSYVLKHKSIRPNSNKRIPTDITVLPEVLKTRGYQTHMVGK